MDRFSWSNGLLEINETLVIQQRGVRLYDGDDKVSFCFRFVEFVGKKHCTSSKFNAKSKFTIQAHVRCFRVHVRLTWDKCAVLID